MTNSEFAREIAIGDKKRKDTDYDVLLAQLHDEAKHLKADLLHELIYQSAVLRARQGGLPVPVRDLPFMPQNGKWFGRGCQYQCCKWEGSLESDGPDYQEAFPSLIYCDHEKNDDDYEGNCGAMTCPRWPVDDERPTEAELGPCTTLTPDDSPAGYDGSTGTRSLEEPGKPSTIMENIVDVVDFKGLVAIADILGISHNYTEWLKDDWPDKEDALRGLVAEAMEKAGK